MTDHEKRIREALEAGPTEREWLIDHRDPRFVYALNVEGYNQFWAHVQGPRTRTFELEANARLIAACNPAAIRALLADLDAMRAERLAALQPQPAAAVSDEEISRLWSWSATAEAERTATTQQHAFAYALLALRPQAVPMTPEQRFAAQLRASEKTEMRSSPSWAEALIEEVEAHHGITAQGAQVGEG